MSEREARIDELRKLRRALKRLRGVTMLSLEDIMRRIDQRIVTLEAQPTGPMFKEELS